MLIEIYIFSFKKIRFKLSSADRRPLCLALYVLTCKISMSGDCGRLWSEGQQQSGEQSKISQVIGNHQNELWHNLMFKKNPDVDTFSNSFYHEQFCHSNITFDPDYHVGLKHKNLFNCHCVSLNLYDYTWRLVPFSEVMNGCHIKMLFVLLHMKTGAIFRSHEWLSYKDAICITTYEDWCHFQKSWMAVI